ncbi:MAG TPA: cold shock and DUF1294 domain-containing protein [Chthoniobacteraceae bacterium]|nr:cold shock and DUF1294 domain-containing protein [Chthoniobacteraceae bacterium]
MNHRGRLKTWNDEKGFGFIASDSRGRDVFLHIHALPKGSARPVEGDTVAYDLGLDERQRPRAVRARLECGRLLWSGKSLALAGAGAFFAAVALGVWRGHIALALLIVYAVMSGLAFVVYAMDKSRAQRGDRRIPEAVLHLLAIFCGWPGALLAQQWLRHKNRKLLFQAIFWIIVLVHVAFWILLAPDRR